MQLWRMLSVGAICFEDRFCATQKGGIGRGGRVSARGAVHMAAALAGCRKALVGTGWAISLLFDTNGHRYRVHSVLAAVFINPLTTECTRHATLGVSEACGVF